MAKTLADDWQILWYALALFTQYGHAYNCLYDVVRFPQRKVSSLSQYKKDLEKEIRKDPSYFFQQIEVEISIDKIKQFEAELILKMDFLHSGLTWKNQCACFAGYGCSYFDACKSNDYSNLIKKKRVFEELSK